MFVFELIFGHCMSSTLTVTIFLQTPHAVTWLPLSFRSRDLHQHSITDLFSAMSWCSALSACPPAFIPHGTL